MEIEKKLLRTTAFKDLSVGDVFILDNDVYMVLEEDYGLGEGRSYDGYAVCLESGSIYSFYNEECIKVTAKLTVTN